MFAVQDRVQSAPLLENWVNGSQYIPTKEHFGILPIADNVQHDTGMVRFVPGMQPKQHYHYLASQQNTRFATLPVHTGAEKRLFSELVKTSIEYIAPNPNWTRCALEWNQNANGTEIYYKVHSIPIFVS
jgi:hypothetical protein